MSPVATVRITAPRSNHPECGTREGYLRHKRRKTKICDACRAFGSPLRSAHRDESGKFIKTRAKAPKASLTWFEDILDVDCAV